MKDIIAIDIKPDCLTDSQGRTQPIDNIGNVLEFCMINKPNTFIVVWNLYQLISVIQKLIPEQQYKTLLDTDKVWVGENGNRYKLFSSQGKRLCIGHEYKEKMSGNFYQSTKVEVDIFNLNRYFPNYNPKDAQDIKDKGIELLKALDQMELGDTNTLASAINIFDKIKLQGAFIPHLYDCPDEMIDMCEYLMPLLTREWRAVYKVGCWMGDKQATDLDIHAGYPSLVQNFGDLSQTKIWYAKKYEPCDWGVFKGYVNITSDKSPIVNKDKQPVKGRYLDYLTTDQWGYLNKTKKGFFEPIDGWMIKFLTNEKPFKDLMTYLYIQRQQSQLISEISKGISVGLIGMFAQTYENKHGNHFNPAYSVMATSRCSLKVAQFIDKYDLWDNLINVIVDGFLIDKPLDIEDTKEIGSWHSERVNAMVLGIGHSYSGTKRPENKTFDDMLKAIQSNPKLSSYNDVVLNKELNTTNRVFDDYPQTGKDILNKVYTSRAIEVNETN